MQNFLKNVLQLNPLIQKNMKQYYLHTNFIILYTVVKILYIQKGKEAEHEQFMKSLGRICWLCKCYVMDFVLVLCCLVWVLVSAVPKAK